MSGETAGERWSPVQRVESVLISVLSLLDDAEISSPANVDASVMLRDSPAKYKQQAEEDVQASRKEVPAGFVMPTHESTKPTVDKVDEDFWADSDADDTFGGSESEGELNMDYDDDDENIDDEDQDHEQEDNEETEDFDSDSQLDEPVNS